MTILGKELLKKHTKENPLPLSFTQWYRNMRVCKLKWYFNYDLKYRKLIPKARIMTEGTNYHKIGESGFNEIKIVDGEVDMFSSVEKQLYELPKEERENVYFLEDWMQTKLEEKGELPKIIGMEEKIKAPPEQIHGLWIQRMGVADMIWLNPDKSYFIWDFKTGEIIEKNKESKNYGKSKSKLGGVIHQLYYYRSIFIKNGMTVSGVGAIYPEDKQFFRRLSGKVPRGTKNTSTIMDKSITNLEQWLKDTIYKILNEDIEPEFNPYHCNEWCDYAQEESLLCNFESVDLSKLKPLGSYLELQLLAEKLQGDDFL